MSVARFFDSTADALVRVTDVRDRRVLEQRLLATTVVLRAGEHIENDEARRTGFLFATDLMSRLYPRIALDGPSNLVAAARARAEKINPRIDIVAPRDDMPTLAFEAAAPMRGVRVAAAGWNVVIDDDSSGGTAEPIASMAAATVGVSELFRDVFGDAISHPRTGTSPGAWNLITCGAPRDGLPSARGTDMHRFHVAGCGAIGQTTLAALGASGVVGTVVAVDPELVELSNLQRYVLTDDESVDQAKVDIVRQALEGTGLRVEPMQHRWSVRFAAQADAVLVALDTADDRIRVQAGLPRALYNAYTDERDLGWSRHERFGADACLACLYWPMGARRSRVEEVADALGEPTARVAVYYASGSAVGMSLPANVSAPRGTAADELKRWQRRPILDDIGERFGIADEELALWRELSIDALYRQAVCGRGLVELADSEGGRRQVSVPLAHQSAMAGIMLAVQFIASRHEGLRALLPLGNDGRLNLSRTPAPYVTNRAPTPGCMCSDSDFRQQFHSRWKTTGGSPSGSL